MSAANTGKNRSSKKDAVLEFASRVASSSELYLTVALRYGCRVLRRRRR
jgi:hypothetical protein